MGIVVCILASVVPGGVESGLLAALASPVGRLVLAVVLGLSLGLEREWSKKPAGIRTFALVSLLGAVFALLGRPVLLAVGGLLVVVQGAVLSASSFRDPDLEGLSLTTAASLLVAYAVGVLVGQGYLLEAATVAFLSSFLLVVKRELHEFAWGLSKAEVRSAIELAIVAFVVFPLLPAEPVDPWGAVAPRTVWLLVVAVSAVGFANYLIVRRYGGRGVAVTGFFGGLVNSTAVIGEVTSLARRASGARRVVVGAVLLADAAMAARNLLLAAAFAPAVAARLVVPLGFVTLVGLAVGWRRCRTDQRVAPDLESPFSLLHALRFGAAFLVVLLATALAQTAFGAAGVVGTAFLAGFASSGSATTTALSLALAGDVSTATAATAVLAGTVASLLVKVGLVASLDGTVAKPVGRWTAALAILTVVGAAVSTIPADLAV
jgi:uncharacterized membrane protein (DUF4010 family)